MSPLVSMASGASARGFGLFGSGAAAPSFESIATVTVSNSTTSSVSFSSIPSTFKALQIRGISRNSDTGSSISSQFMQINSDTGSNYAFHRLQGNGTSASATGANATSYIPAHCSPTSGVTSGVFGGTIVDIYDYASTTKNKTVRIFTGADANGSGTVFLNSGLWVNTNAITSLKFSISDNPSLYFQIGSTFALYGIKG